MLVGLGGFEPPTSPLSGVRSNQLSYRPGSVQNNSLKKRIPQILNRVTERKSNEGPGLPNCSQRAVQAIEVSTY